MFKDESYRPKQERTRKIACEMFLRADPRQPNKNFGYTIL